MWSPLLSPVGNWSHRYFESSICFGNFFFPPTDSSDFRVGNFAFKVLALPKFMLNFGYVFVFVVEFPYACVDIPCLHWLQGRFRLCCRVGRVSSPSSELKTSPLCLGSSVSGCSTVSTTHASTGTGDERFCCPLLPQGGEEEVSNCLATWYSNALDTTINSQGHHGIFWEKEWYSPSDRHRKNY